MLHSVQEHVNIGAHTTFKTGGLARYFVVVTTKEEVKAAIVFAQERHLPLFVLGSGSNVLVPDDGYDGMVIEMRIAGVNYQTVSASVMSVTVGAGELLDRVIAETVARGLWGLENLSHIPGTVGATPVQNVGAYGVEVADCITEVLVCNQATGETESLDATACKFGYRDSIFKHHEGAHFIILSVTFALSTLPRLRLDYADLAALKNSVIPLQPQLVRDTVIRIRSEKFPDWTVVGTAGSFFKNPTIAREHAERLLEQYPTLPVYPVDTNRVKVSLAFILDKVCGLKGYAKNNVGLYEKQALVVVAQSPATTSEVCAFTDDIVRIVFEKTNISIEREVTMMH